jgi:hypothetical protein
MCFPLRFFLVCQNLPFRWILFRLILSELFSRRIVEENYCMEGVAKIGKQFVIKSSKKFELKEI